jgi:hypothetical protein
MQILNKGNGREFTRPAHTSVQSRKNYYIWLGAQLAVISIIAAALIVESFIVYNKTLNLLNSSNQYMVDKAGIEATTGINQTGLTQTEGIVEKKEKPPTPPNKLRNIFTFDSYATIFSGLEIPMPIPTATSTTSTVSSSTVEE